MRHAAGRAGCVLRRDRFRRYLSFDEVDAYLLEIEVLCRMVDDPDPVPQILQDPDDDYLVALASECGAAPSFPATSTCMRLPAYQWRS
ncbi:MAG: hypothetical protein ACRD1K_04195 [Acidimicrobiales bacterium]